MARSRPEIELGGRAQAAILISHRLDELFFLAIPRIEMRADKDHPPTETKGETS
jgi:hypothetical protein